jgi:predicted molibdopterin-dependent oxidoreductase YjgC
VRQAIGHQGETRAEWSVLAELSRRMGNDLGVLTGPMVTAQVVDAVPFYGGLTLDGIGGQGVRWQELPGAAAYPAAALGPFELETPPAAPGTGDGRLRLGTFRSVWAAVEVENSPALKFLHPRQRVEISPADARRLSVFEGERVLVGSNGTSVSATVALRDAVPEGSVFMETAIPEESAWALEGPLVEVRKAPATRGDLSTATWERSEQ